MVKPKVRLTGTDGNVFSIIGYSLVLLVPHWGAVIAGMFLFLSWTCFSLPATFSLVGAAVPVAAAMHAAKMKAE